MMELLACSLYVKLDLLFFDKGLSFLRHILFRTASESTARTSTRLDFVLSLFVTSAYIWHVILLLFATFSVLDMIAALGFVVCHMKGPCTSHQVHAKLHR